ncbi:aldehyde dehydrogenase family protein [Streptomyces tricolor]|nr:aldehyde dehydrogenase family protein [Streptomyces tricolor]
MVFASDRPDQGPGRPGPRTPARHREPLPARAARPTSWPGCAPYFATGRTKPVAWRTAQLRRLRALLTERGADLAAALHADLGKSSTEAYRTEIDFTVREIDHTLEHLADWLRPEPAPPSRRTSAPTPRPGRGTTAGRRPRHRALELPARSCLPPPVGALASWERGRRQAERAGPATSAALAELIPAYLDTDAVAVVEGGVPETTGLLAERFDHIFYTGNGTVGRIVMRAAAEHLTPVTLELGGKSPVLRGPRHQMWTWSRTGSPAASSSTPARPRVAPTTS